MKIFIGILLLLGVFILTGAAWISFSGEGKKFAALHLPKKSLERSPEVNISRLRAIAKTAREFAVEKNYNPDFCFLIDMSAPSGTERFFVFDMRGDTILKSGLVTHGRCNEQWLEGRKYGNKPGCGCSSLGKYRIGGAYNGKFGLAFKLHGLEKSNDKAFERFVVLHAHDCVPTMPVEQEICQSDGCPTVSPPFLKVLEPMIRRSDKPVLLWIFE